MKSAQNQSFTMKGVDEIRSFLDSGKDFSASKDALPHPQVDREALIKVLLDLHAENLALKANMPRVNSTASAGPSSSTSSASATSSELAAERNKKSGDNSSVKEDKPEELRLCPSMWGTKACVGRSECQRKHLDLCTNPTCYGNEEHRKACANGPDGKWHGHIKGAIKAEKKRERKEAEQRQFQAWLKQRGNESRGTRGDPPRQKPPQKPTKNPQTQKQDHQRKGRQHHPQRREDWPAPRPKPLRFGDYVPAPPPAVNAWTKDKTDRTNRTDQVQQLVQMQIQFLQGLL